MSSVQSHSKLIRAGLWIWLIGCGPLLLVVLANLIGLGDDNPLGLGLLFVVAAPIGLIFIIIGTIRRWMTRDQPDTSRSVAPSLAVKVDPILTDPAAEAKLHALTPGQEIYLAGNSMGAGWGLWYYIYMGTPGAFFKNLPGNFSWIYAMHHARQQVWDEGSWEDFDAFRKHNQLADVSATIILAICIPLLVVLLGVAFL